MGWMDGNLDGRTYINLLCDCLLPKNSIFWTIQFSNFEKQTLLPPFPAASLKGAPAT